jgi:arylsulfatase A-like enzyme
MKVVLIALDTLRADHLGCYGHPFDTSPCLDRLSREGILFERHYSTDVPTPPAYTALLSGQRGTQTGIFGFGKTNYDFSTVTRLLAEQLAQQGYRTGMVSNLLYVCPWLTRGFRDIVPPGLRFQGGTAEEVTEESKAWLDRFAGKDFFLFVHYWDPHVPYFKRAPQAYQDMFFAEDYSSLAPTTEYLEKSPLVNAAYRGYSRHALAGRYEPRHSMPCYDAGIRYADDGVNGLVEHLEKLGIAEDVLILVTSDHGEAFGERGFYDHLSSNENVCHVPLIVRWPKEIGGGGRVAGYTLGTDLMPTILDLCGLPVPEGIDGRTLKGVLLRGEESSRDEVVTNGASIPIQRMYIKDGWALVHTLDRSIYDYLNAFELFDLSKDPAQETDLGETETERFISMRGALDRWLDRELHGLPDRLQNIALRGGGWGVGSIQSAFYREPDLFMENPRARSIITELLGRSAQEYYEKSKEKRTG